jgi:hypothetical protein
LSHLLCVGETISFPWFSKELKNDLSKNNWLRGIILILLLCESIFVGWGFPFPIVLVPRYKLSLCHTPIKLDLLSFPGNWCLYVWVAWPRDHEVHIIWYQSLAPLIRLYHFISCIFVFSFRVNFSLHVLSLFRVWSCSNQFGQIVFFICYSWLVALNWVFWDSFFLEFLFRVKKIRKRYLGERDLFRFFLHPLIKPYCNCVKIDILVI